MAYETIRDLSLRFGGTYAKRLRARVARPGDHWHLDEVYLSINGKLQYLWRAVDQDGEVLDILVQPRRDKQAAKAEIMPDVVHRQDKRSNNRAEIRISQRVSGACAASNPPDMPSASWRARCDCLIFWPGRHLLSAANYREIMRNRFAQWSEVTSSNFVFQ